MFNWAKGALANVAGTAEPIYGPTAIRSVSHQTQATTHTVTKKEDVQWKAIDSTCVETQVWYIIADSGHLIILQVIYSNVANIKKTCQFNTKIFYPNRSKPSLWSSDELKAFEFDEEKYSCFNAENVAVTLSEDGTEYKIKSMANQNSIVDVTITKAGPGFVAGEDGLTLYGTDLNKPWGSMRHVFWPRNTAKGQVLTKDGPIDVAGKTMFVMALQGMKPHHAAAKWNFLNFQSPKYSATVMNFTTPPSYGLTVVNVGGIITDDGIVLAGVSSEIIHTEVKGDPEADWPEPKAIKATWAGKTPEGKDVTAVLEIDLGERVDRVDVMAEVPVFIKKIANATAGTRPYIYQYITKPVLKVTIDGETTEEQGTMLSEATFIS